MIVRRKHIRLEIESRTLRMAITAGGESAPAFSDQPSQEPAKATTDPVTAISNALSPSAETTTTEGTRHVR